MERGRFSVRSNKKDQSPVQVASAREMDMGMALTKEATLTKDQLMRRNNVLLAPYGSQHLVPPRYGVLPEGQVSNLVAGFLDSLDSTPPSPLKRAKYHVVHIASEMAPVAKVGGLADVVTGLGRSLLKKGHRVEIIIPKYKCMDVSCVRNFKKLNKQFYSYFDGAMHKNVVWTGVVEGLWVYFIDTHHPNNFFNREKIYNEPDDFERFTYFSRAALEFLLQFGKRPNIIHCHDWPVAMVAPFYRSIYAALGLNSKIAFTCHNFESQGKNSLEALVACGIRFAAPLHKNDFQDDVLPDQINVMKSGLLHSDFVTTVSPTYAREVLTPEGGEGLHTTIQALPKFHGIVNGIDDIVWNPATDPLLDHHFDADNLKGKQFIKDNLRSRLKMAFEGDDAKRPLVCCVTRLVPQKGVHLLCQAIFHVLKQGGQFILQGTSEIPAIKEEFENLRRQFQDHPHIRLVLRCEEALTHNIFAGADIFVIPSIFEPCGLTQMYAMRYGTIPVVRKTGGLADSVFDKDDKSVPLQKRNGFTFINPDEQDMAHALDRAMDLYKNHQQEWEQFIRHVMRLDFSWDAAPINHYITLYDTAVNEDNQKLMSYR